MVFYLQIASYQHTAATKSPSRFIYIFIIYSCKRDISYFFIYYDLILFRYYRMGKKKKSQKVVEEEKEVEKEAQPEES